nr:NOTCH1-like protein [Parasacculina yatsui]
MSSSVLAVFAVQFLTIYGQTFINYSGGLPSVHHTGYGAASRRHDNNAHLSHHSPAARADLSDPCQPSPCGPNTRCSINARGIVACHCLDGFFPKPNTIVGCGPQCVSDQECHNPQYVCRNQKCINPCLEPGTCGVNANCNVRNHQVVCTCPSGYQGSAHIHCHAPQLAVHQRSQARGPPAPPTDPCAGGVCGINANCEAVNGRAVCSCPQGSQGDPLTSCRRGECTYDSECPLRQACIDVKCQDPCLGGVCGVGAKCSVENHRAICSCPKNYLGDPFTLCRYNPEAACTPSPCGKNTNCRVQGGQAVCSCIGSYIGNPLTGCRPECVSDTECSASQVCAQNRCKNACTGTCGKNARCEAVNHRPVCECPKYYKGNGITGCYPECVTHSECPSHKACINHQCGDPCVNACGTGAECEVTNHKAICKCPKGYDGHPFDRCYPAPPRDVCVPNPCGSNAECNHGTDRENKPRPVCTCAKGYFGNPLISCARGECENSQDCASTKACYNYSCVNPCFDSTGTSVCGTNAQCDVKNHKAICSCLREYTGDPLTECRLKPIARSNTGLFKR